MITLEQIDWLQKLVDDGGVALSIVASTTQEKESLKHLEQYMAYRREQAKQERKQFFSDILSAARKGLSNDQNR